MSRWLEAGRRRGVVLCRGHPEFAWFVLLLLLSILQLRPSTCNDTSKSGRPIRYRLPGNDFDPTIVSGFGSRSSRNSVFKTGFLSRLKKTLNQTEEDDELKNPLRPFSLWILRTDDPSKIFLQLRPSDSIGTVRTIQVSTAGRDWSVSEDSLPRWRHKDWVPIEGIYGLYEVPSGFVWAFVTKTARVYTAPPVSTESEEPWWEIRRVMNVELVHLADTTTQLSETDLQEEVRQLRLLRKSLKQHKFYCCAEPIQGGVIDMTKNLQKCVVTRTDDSNDEHWWKNPDPRFFWNQACLDPIVKKYDESDSRSAEHNTFLALLRAAVPLTSAFVGVNTNITVTPDKDVDDKNIIRYDQLLISRRSRFRAGTRFTRRGADGTGAVANFVESEQLCFVVDDSSDMLKQAFSHVQTRGSVPLRWSSPTDIKTYRPRVRIGIDPLAQARALRLHLLELQSQYVYRDENNRSEDDYQIVIVNLLDKVKDQGRLGRTLDAVLQAVVDIQNSTVTPSRNSAHDGDDSQDSGSLVRDLTASNLINAKHLWFDFHAEVKNGNWDKLQKLLSKLIPQLERHSFCAAKPSFENKELQWIVESLQRSSVRTNCLDSLDRTGVVQSLIARYILLLQVCSSLAGLKEGTASELVSPLFSTMDPMQLPWSEGETAHRLLWADNADEISRLYAGTPALKRDFTRHGRRTRRGALDDGMNSALRFYLNNFLDADRQEGIDLMLGDATFSDPTTTAHDSDGSGMASGSVRSSLFASILGGEMERSLKNQLADAGISADSEDLDLRWIPGDLQEHLRSQVASQQLVDGPSSSAALKEIDLRASSDLPCWAAQDSDNDQPPGSESPEYENTDSLRPGTGSIGQRSLTGSFLLGVLLAGVHAPSAIAAAVVGILVFVSLPTIIEQTMQS